jgi:hypothetical protein
MRFKAMGKTTTLAALALLLVLAAPAAAPAAVRVIAPPGNSEADQYYQTLPSATGPRAPDSSKEARDAVRDGVLTEGTESALRQEGPAGLTLLTGIAKTAPAGGAGGGVEGGGPSSAGGVRVLDDQGLGDLFPLVLALAAAGALAFAVTRRRRPVAR